MGTAGSIIAVILYSYYLVRVLHGDTKPHPYSWLIWSLVAGISGAGQIAGGGGAGSWVTITSSFMCFIIFLSSLKYGEKRIHSFDTTCLLVSLLAIPLWILTDTPLWSVILVTIVDTVGFIPTIRKSYFKPYEEAVLTYIGSSLKNGLGILALETHSLVTLLYPGTLLLTCTLFSVLILLRRHALKIDTE